MARIRRRTKVSFDSKTVIDVGIAGVATRLIPQLLNKFLPLDPTLYAVAGAGGTFLVGTMLKKPVMANAGIALGLVELVSPVLEELIGSIGGAPVAPVGLIKGAPVGSVRLPSPPIKAIDLAMNDYLDLREYTNSPDMQSNLMYKGSY